MKFHPVVPLDGWHERIRNFLSFIQQREIYGSLISFQLCSNMHFLLKIHFASRTSFHNSWMTQSHLNSSLPSALEDSFNAGNS